MAEIDRPTFFLTMTTKAVSKTTYYNLQKSEIIWVDENGIYIVELDPLNKERKPNEPYYYQKIIHKVFNLNQEGFPIYVATVKLPSMNECFKNV